MLNFENEPNQYTRDGPGVDLVKVCEALRKNTYSKFYDYLKLDTRDVLTVTQIEVYNTNATSMHAIDFYDVMLESDALEPLLLGHITCASPALTVPAPVHLRHAMKRDAHVSLVVFEAMPLLA